MKIKKLLLEYCDNAILENEDGRKAFEEFLRKLPGRILEVDIDETKTNKVGFKDGETVYKLGVITEKDLVFVEYYENAAQGQPTMMIIAERTDKKLVIKGRQVNRTFYLGFKVMPDGTVDKQQKIE